MSEQAATVRLELTYQVDRAYWAPAYDLSSEGTDQPLKLVYKGEVHQNTGVSWENVSLALSTGNPNLGNNLPRLYPVYVDILREDEVNIRGARAKSDFAISSPMESQDEVMLADVGNATVEEGLVNAFFEIPGKYSVPSNNRPYAVGISQHELPASYTYYAAPVRSNVAFLSASVSDWEALKLLPGEVRIYYQNRLVGKSRINPNRAEEYMRFSLGRDQEVKVERERIADLEKNANLLGNNKKWYGYRIKIHNAKSREISILVEDQIPVSRNTDVQVETEELSGGQLNPENGFIRWNKQVGPGDITQMELKYTVRFPKGSRLIGH